MQLYKCECIFSYTKLSRIARNCYCFASCNLTNGEKKKDIICGDVFYLVTTHSLPRAFLCNCKIISMVVVLQRNALKMVIYQIISYLGMFVNSFQPFFFISRSTFGYGRSVKWRHKNNCWLLTGLPEGKDLGKKTDITKHTNSTQSANSAFRLSHFQNVPKFPRRGNVRS